MPFAQNNLIKNYNNNYNDCTKKKMQIKFNKFFFKYTTLFSLI